MYSSVQNIPYMSLYKYHNRVDGDGLIHRAMICTLKKSVRSTSRINSLHHSFIPTPFGRETHAGIALLLNEVQARWGIALRLVYMKVDGLVLLQFSLMLMFGFLRKTLLLLVLVVSYPAVKNWWSLAFNFMSASFNQAWYEFSLTWGSFCCCPVQMMCSF